MATTFDNTLAAGKMAAYLEMYRFGMKHFMCTFKAVPDDKMFWKATDTARHAFQIGAHVAATNEFFLKCLQGEPPATDFAGAMVWINDRASLFENRADLMANLEQVGAELDKTLEATPAEALANENAAMIISIAAIHAQSHSSQIDLLQTCWGDMEFHFGE